MDSKSQTQPTAETRDEEAREARESAGPGQMPTPEEEKAAEEAEDDLESQGLTAEVSKNYREMTELGANAKGEGRID